MYSFVFWMRPTCLQMFWFFPMHVPGHTDILTDGVAPIPVPDTKREAEMLLILLEAGLYPKCRRARPRLKRKNFVKP